MRSGDITGVAGGTRVDVVLHLLSVEIQTQWGRGGTSRKDWS